MNYNLSNLSKKEFLAQHEIEQERKRKIAESLVQQVNAINTTVHFECNKHKKSQWDRTIGKRR